jgi:hypothetical protein
MTEYEKCSLLIRAVGVLVTLVAIAVAIWGERIRQLWSKPRLAISLHDPVFNTTRAGKGAWYYLISVANSRRSSPAPNTRLLLTGVWKKDPTGSWYERVFSGPIQVLWRWQHVSPQFPTIGPETLATFGWLREDELFRLQLYLYPNNLQESIPADEPTQLVFRAVSDTAESKPLTVEVAWDGIWVEARDQIANHCVVRPVSR